jgi:Zn-dependent M16 (insulinase) family peptidase
MRRSLRSWVYGHAPWECLSPGSAFAEVKRRQASSAGYINGLLERLLLNNPQRTRVTVYPDPRYNEARQKAEERLAEELLAGADPETVRRESAELNRLQETPDDDAKAACLPHVRPSDLSVKTDKIVTTEEKAQNGAPLFRNTENTNGIVYVTVGFPLDGLSPADYPLLPFFTTALSNTGFGGKSWEECAQEIALTLGGFNATLFTASPISGQDSLYAGRPWLFVQIKTLAEKTGDALALLAECLCSAEFAGDKRLLDLLFETRNDIRAGVIPSGHEYAMLRAARFFNASRALDEAWNGLSQLFTMQSLLAEGPEACGPRLKRLRKSLLESGAILHVTAGGFSGLEKPLERFISRTGIKPPAPKKNTNLSALFPLTVLGDRSSLESESAVEFCAAPSQVGFAAAACEASPYGSPESVHEAVFSHWFSNTLLWEQIRTIGGAYGAFAFADSVERVFTLATYRDPKPEVSLDVFMSCLQKARSAPFSRETVERAIAGAYSKEVQPRSPSGRGFTGLIRRLTGVTDEMREEKIGRILAVTGDDMRNAADRLCGFAQKRLARTIVGAAQETAAMRKITLPC